jgi:lipopolysaccharide export system permease protein
MNEFLLTFGLCLVIFTFVLVMGNVIKLAELVIAKGVDLIYVLKLFGYLTPYLLSYSVPMAVLTATLLCFGRLSSDNEITAMRASGINLYRISAPAIIIGLALSLGLFFLNDKVLPYSHYQSRRVLADIGIKKPTAFLESGTFIKNFKDYIIFIYEIKGNRLKDIRIYQPQKDRPVRTIIAKRGEFSVRPHEGVIKLRLYNGSSDEPDFDNPTRFFKLRFKIYEVTLNLKDFISKIDKKPKDMTIAEIKQQMAELKQESIEDTNALKVEMYKKSSLAFSALAFVLLGIPLGITSRRSERSVGFGISLGVIIVYYAFAIACESLSLKGRFNPAFAMWIPNGLLILSGLFMMYKTNES